MPVIFSYGSLQEERVQYANFGRALHGHVDSLPGFELTVVEIADKMRAAAIGKTHHANVVRTTRGDCSVRGMALEVTDAELDVADVYEQLDHYVRISVRLASGREAWVYVYEN